MMQKVDRIDAITEIYSLGREAEELIGRLAEAQDKATISRLEGWPIIAGQFNTEASMLAAELEKIGKRQNEILFELDAAGEVFYL